jgi:hypothetical protein
MSDNDVCIEEDDEFRPECNNSASEDLLTDVPEQDLWNKIAPLLGKKFLGPSQLLVKKECYELTGRVEGNERPFIIIPTSYTDNKGVTITRDVLYILDTGAPRTRLSTATLRSLRMPFNVNKANKEHVKILVEHVKILVCTEISTTLSFHI